MYNIAFALGTEAHSASTSFIDTTVSIEEVAFFILFTIIVIKGLAENLAKILVDGWGKTSAYVLSFVLVGILGLGVVTSATQCTDCEVVLSALAALMF